MIHVGHFVHLQLKSCKARLARAELIERLWGSVRTPAALAACRKAEHLRGLTREAAQQLEALHKRLNVLLMEQEAWCKALGSLKSQVCDCVLATSM